MRFFLSENPVHPLQIRNAYCVYIATLINYTFKFLWDIHMIHRKTMTKEKRQ